MKILVQCLEYSLGAIQILYLSGKKCFSSNSLSFSLPQYLFLGVLQEGWIAFMMDYFLLPVVPCN